MIGEKIAYTIYVIIYKNVPNRKGSQMCKEMSKNIKKKIAIGVEDFKEIIDKGSYFVDKTLMIKKLIEGQAKVTLFTRPRRFGKTLNQFMIRRFFEDEITEKGEKVDNGYLFDGLKIAECGEEIMKHQQQYPVIFLTLKSAKQPDFEMAYACLIDEICKEFQRHSYVLAGEMPQRNRERFERIQLGKGSRDEYAKALGFLSECLFKYHEKKTIILIDEYDVPLENAYFRGFYDEMIDFIRSLFESALKTNPYLEKSVITGCLRISKESIFTGLNNLETDSVLHTRYGDAFGFTQEEVEAMLAYYDLNEQLEEVKRWYDGYLFNDFEIYNPWSILKYVNDRKDHVTKFPLPYWSNTSSNSIVHEMVEEADEDARRDLETLMDSGTIEKIVHEDITYADIHKSQDNLWNFLFFTGYLKKMGEWTDAEEDIHLKMAIPNLEIKKIYRESITEWFDQRIKKKDRSPLVRALEDGDCEAAENFINEQLFDTISYFDYAESYYHGFMAGLLKNAGRYAVYSNRESGNGRPDIVMQTANIRKGRVIILELKIAASIAEMQAACDRGLAQIEEQRYAEPFTTEGYPEVKKYALSFYKKECMVKKAE